MTTVIDTMVRFSQASLDLVQQAFRAGGSQDHWQQAKESLLELQAEAVELGFTYSATELRRVVAQVERCIIDTEVEMDRLKAAGFCA